MTPNSDYTSKISDNGTSDRMRDTLDHASHKVGDLARTAGERLGDAASSVRDRMTSTGRSARGLVVENPIRSMAIGLGVGVVLGMLLARAMR